MFNSLKNIGVLITRPLHQATNLATQITGLGGRAILFPTIEIADTDDQVSLQAKIQQLENHQLVIFISPNAVAKAMPLIHQILPVWPPQVKIAAIGASTVKKLQTYQLKVDYSPTDIYNTESLLSLPVFKHVAGQKIMVIRGEDGRGLLASTLQNQGAEITEVVAYRRILPKIPARLPFSQNEIDIIVCTSNTGVQNLVAMCPKMDRTWLQNMSLLVISRRMIPMAKTLGFVKTPVLAENATDHAIVRALVNWQEKINGECAN